MVEYKNQHFVPELLLRGWSTDEQVTTLHLKPGHEERGQAISKICSSNYLYTNSQDTTLEQELGSLENFQARPIKYLRGGAKPSNLSVDLANCLYSYVMTQRLRTKSYRQEIRFGSEQVYEGVFIKKLWPLYNPEEKLRIDVETIEALKESYIKQAARNHQNYIMMHGFLGIVIRDLDIILLKNNTEKGFICSDSPIVLDNISQKMHGDYLSYPGFANRGILIYCPISPEYYVVIYDKSAYNFNHDKNNCLDIDDVNEVVMLNKLQLMNAQDIILYDDNNSRSELIEEYKIIDNIYDTKPISCKFETLLETVEYELIPEQPFPNTGNIFNQMIVDPHYNYKGDRDGDLDDYSVKFVHELADKYPEINQAAIAAIRLAISILQTEDDD